MNLGEGKIRLAIVDPQRCQPTKCQRECIRACPVVRTGKKDCVTIDRSASKPVATISEELCIGCNMCVKKCPFDAVSIINLPSSLASEVVYRYGVNSFKLHRLPLPRPGQVLGIIGINGLGKSTALQILAGRVKPNFGKRRHLAPTSWNEVIDHYKGTEHQNFFTQVQLGNIKPVVKPQYVDAIPKAVSGTVGNQNLTPELLETFELTGLTDRTIDQLSGGELQRFAIATACHRMSTHNLLILDEPSSYLDIEQRVKMCQRVRQYATDDRYLVVVEHDISVLDYLSDTINVIYGEAGKYGIVASNASNREGINEFLDGFIRSENMRFRDEPLKFIRSVDEEPHKVRAHYQYPAMSKTLPGFSLHVEAGEYRTGEITLLVGRNGMGKTTFMRMLAGILPPDSGQEVPRMNISYKPQKITPKAEMTVEQLFYTKIRDAMMNAQFVAEVIRPLDVDDLYSRTVATLSGGELQRVAIVLCLGTPADVYLLDEPSAYLDVEQRVNVSRVVKRFIRHSQKSAFIIEHDFMMTTYLADSMVVFEGVPGVSATTTTTLDMTTGMNRFLKKLGVTFRRDPETHRPRINKLHSQKDVEQKRDGIYFN